MSSRRLPGALQEFREVAKLYPMIQAQEMIVDNTCMQLVGKPNQFDVMVRSTAHATGLVDFFLPVQNATCACSWSGSQISWMSWCATQRYGAGLVDIFFPVQGPTFSL